MAAGVPVEMRPTSTRRTAKYLGVGCLVAIGLVVTITFLGWLVGTRSGTRPASTGGGASESNSVPGGAPTSSGEVTTATGAKAYGCPQKVIDYIDTMNRNRVRAEIWKAYCQGDRSAVFDLLTRDGRKLTWRTSEGPDELARRMYFGQP
jgi:hypothetical protein